MSKLINAGGRSLPKHDHVSGGAVGRAIGLAVVVALTGACSSELQYGTAADAQASDNGNELVTTRIVTSEICDNGLDDDGNGLVDDLCTCVPGTTQRCYIGDPAHWDIGECVSGQQPCLATDSTNEFGRWGPCEGSGLPTQEICGDGLDQDCDGHDVPCSPNDRLSNRVTRPHQPIPDEPISDEKVDEPIPDDKVKVGLALVCRPGQTESQDCGNCGQSTRVCLRDGTWDRWGACSGEGVCFPGQTLNESCPNGTPRSRTCTRECQWGAPGPCEGLTSFTVTLQEASGNQDPSQTELQNFSFAGMRFNYNGVRQVLFSPEMQQANLWSEFHLALVNAIAAVPELSGLRVEYVGCGVWVVWDFHDGAFDNFYWNTPVQGVASTGMSGFRWHAGVGDARDQYLHFCK